MFFHYVGLDIQRETWSTLTDKEGFDSKIKQFSLQIKVNGDFAQSLHELLIGYIFGTCVMLEILKCNATLSKC